MAYVGRVVSSLILGATCTVVLVMVSIAVSWALDVTWRVPFVLSVSAGRDGVLFVPHALGLVTVGAVLATVAAAAGSSNAHRKQGGQAT